MKTSRGLGAVAAVVACAGWTCSMAEESGSRAQVNPCNGMQTREDVFAFTQKPKVERRAGGYVVTFASKGACDASVWAESPDGRVVCHIGSGVLGRNAPWPFQQDSLSQRIEWDGKDDMGKPVPSGSVVKVGLGLRAAFERNIAHDPYKYDPKPKYSWHAKLADGRIMVVCGRDVRLFDRDGKYLKTLAPHSAATPKDKLSGLQGWAKTVEGDELPLPPGRLNLRTGFFSLLADGVAVTADPAAGTITFGGKAFYYTVGVDGSFAKSAGPGPAPAAEGPGPIQKSDMPGHAGVYRCQQPRIAADRAREEIYVHWGGGHICDSGVFRYNGKTGEHDKTWPDIGADQTAVGPDGLIYLRTGSYGRSIVRVDHEGKVVPFPKGVTLPKGYTTLPTYLNKYAGDVNGVPTGGTSGSNVQQPGFAISPATGDIYLHMKYVDEAWAAANVPAWKKGAQILNVFAPDGSLKFANAFLPRLPDNDTGIGVDRWGNLYKGMRKTFGAKVADGLDPSSKGPAASFGSVVRFQGGQFPLGPLDKPSWTYPGFSVNGGSACTCADPMFDVDPYGRTFVPAMHLYSVMVLDANGNRVLRVGRYGNVDDEGIRFAWVRATAVSDRALYALDYGNRRVLKSALNYAAEESVNVP